MPAGLCCHAARAAPAARPAQRRARCRAEIEAGSAVRVTATVVAFHAPGKKEGMQMEGKEGVVETVTDTAKLSATQPYRVKFSWEEGGKDKKVFMHFADFELEELD